MTAGRSSTQLLLSRRPFLVGVRGRALSVGSSRPPPLNRRLFLTGGVPGRTPSDSSLTFLCRGGVAQMSAGMSAADSCSLRRRVLLRGVPVAGASIFASSSCCLLSTNSSTFFFRPRVGVPTTGISATTGGKRLSLRRRLLRGVPAPDAAATTVSCCSLMSVEALRALCRVGVPITSNGGAGRLSLTRLLRRTGASGPA